MNFFVPFIHEHYFLTSECPDITILDFYSRTLETDRQYLNITASIDASENVITRLLVATRCFFSLNYRSS